MVNTQCNCFLLYTNTSSIVSIALSVRRDIKHNVSLNLPNSFVTIVHFSTVLAKCMSISTRKSHTTWLLEHLPLLIRPKKIIGDNQFQKKSLEIITCKYPHIYAEVNMKLRPYKSRMTRYEWQLSSIFHTSFSWLNLALLHVQSRFCGIVFTLIKSISGTLSSMIHR